MGTYLFKTEVLLELLTAKPPATDFGKEVFPRNVSTKQIHAHLFDGYWEDIGTLDRRAMTKILGTVDTQTLQDETVTIRHRDDRRQERIKIADAVDTVRKALTETP